MIFFSFLYFLGYLTSNVVSLSCKDGFPSNNHIGRLDYTRYALTYEYTGSRFISSGAYGAVYSVRKKNGSHRFALKATKTEKAKSYFIQEARALCEFQGSKNILQITDWGVYRRSFFHKYFFEFVIVTELALTNAVDFFEDKHHNYEMLDDFVNLQEKPDIKDYMSVLGNDSKKLIELKSRFVEAVINALTDMHAKNFIHRDLKWSNVLVFDKEAKIIKLADLGFCEMDVDITSCRGTLYSIAPELIPTGKIAYLTIPICGKSADIYSLGVMIIQMFPFILHSKRLYSQIYPLIHKSPSVRPNIKMVKRIFQNVRDTILNDVSFLDDIKEKEKQDIERRRCQLFDALCYV